MIEAEWLANDNPDVLLDHLLGCANVRKLRLFACASGAPLWRLVQLPACKEAYEAALQFADGHLAPDALEMAWRAGQAAQPLFPDIQGAAVAAADPDLISALARSTQLAADAAARLQAEGVMTRARAAVASGAEAERHAEAWGKFDHALETARNDARLEQVRYLRCLFGDLFHPTIIDPAWLTCNDGTVPKLAQAIYDQQRFGDLPILADALEEAGCTDDEILGHCRHDWEHFRGCFVLDAILGK